MKIFFLHHSAGDLVSDAVHSFGEFTLGFGHGDLFVLIFQVLPEVNHLGGLVEDVNPVSFSNPMFGFKFVFELLPSVGPGPEEVGGEGTSAFAHNLIHGDRHVLVEPEDFKNETGVYGRCCFGCSHKRNSQEM